MSSVGSKMTNTTQVTLIEVSDWDKLVTKTYNKPYNFQQQDNCKERGIHKFTVPEESIDYPDVTDSFEEEGGMGVSFKSWLERSPDLPLKNQEYDWELVLWWHRHFYPSVEMIINDLYSRGILKPGKYIINIDW